MCNALNKLFNVILSTVLNPYSWKTGVNVPIYKSGDLINLSNYHRTTLNSSFGKRLCQIANYRIADHLEDNNVFLKEQAVLREKKLSDDRPYIRSTKDH